jgi:hypothetical protein
MAERDWYDWHAHYDDPGSGLSRRLSWVQDRIRAALDGAPPGPVRAPLDPAAVMFTFTNHNSKTGPARS